MKNSYYLLIILSILIIILHHEVPLKIHYPVTKQEKVYDTYFDTTITDPYRWLEDDHSKATKAWVIKQNALTSSYMRRIPQIRKVKNRLREIWNYPWQSAPFIKGDKLYYYRNEGLQNQSVLYVQDKEGGIPKVLLDPNKFSSDGTIALGGTYFSNDHRYLGYALSSAGSDWQEFFIMDLSTGELLGDRLKWIKFSGMSWQDNGFYYTRMPEQNTEDEFTAANEHSKVYYHKLGTTQETDELIFYDPATPRISASVIVTEDERYMLLYRYRGTYGNSLAFRDTRRAEDGWTTIIDDYNSEITILDHAHGALIAVTDRSAPNKKIVRIDPEHSQEEHWVTLVKGTEEAVLQWANIVGNRLLVHFTRDILSEWKVYDLNGSYLYTVELPGRGVINGFGGSQDQSVTWYNFNNLITPETIYRYDIYSNTSSLYKESESSFKSGNYILKQEFYSSRDGTKVPIFIVHKKNLYLDNRRPTLLYGYGGFNIAMKPYFSKALTVILENDGVYALANIRGGSEYGEKWHQGGMLFNKQNVFDDFTAAAEYLFIQGYTDPDYLAIRGRSNGGLLIGAVLNQKPQICKVAFPEVGVMDMLRYEEFTIGYAWAVEYGSVKNEANFTNLLSYSPLHNINTDIQYPSILIYTADHDDRVVPAHSFKYAAAMQRAQAGQDPILIRIGRNAGHGRGRPTRKIIDEYAEKWGFMFYEMGVAIRP